MQFYIFLIYGCEQMFHLNIRCALNLIYYLIIFTWLETAEASFFIIIIFIIKNIAF